MEIKPMFVNTSIDNNNSKETYKFSTGESLIDRIKNCIIILNNSSKENAKISDNKDKENIRL
jgi:hypothetical protein